MITTLPAEFSKLLLGLLTLPCCQCHQSVHTGSTGSTGSAGKNGFVCGIVAVAVGQSVSGDDRRSLGAMGAYAVKVGLQSPRSMARRRLSSRHKRQIALAKRLSRDDTLLPRHPGHLRSILKSRITCLLCRTAILEPWEDIAMRKYACKQRLDGGQDVMLGNPTTSALKLKSQDDVSSIAAAHAHCRRRDISQPASQDALPVKLFRLCIGEFDLRRQSQAQR